MARPKQRATRLVLHRRGPTGVWWFRFTFEGRQHRESTGETRRDQAQEVAERRRVEIIAGGGERDEVHPADLPMGELFDRYQRHLDQTGRVFCTIRHYTGYVKKYHEFFGDVSPLSLGKRKVERYRQWLLDQKCQNNPRGTLSMKTVAEHLNLIRAVCRHFDLPDATKGVERPRKKQSERIESMEFYSADELRAMREAAGPELTNALEFLAFTGCRVGEMRGVRTSDMEPGRRVVRVTGKGSKTRPLTLAGPLSAAWDALEREAIRRGVEDGHVFRQYVGFPRFQIS